jgi:hypothetical protein
LSSGGAEPLKLVAQQGGGDAVSEAYIQSLVHEHPACLPIAEIDAMFSGPVPICTELNTPAGPIDNFMVTPSGLPVLVECKLWRNPEARREVVSQILDYAKELSRWSSSDVQREVSHRLKRDGNPLLDMVRAVDPEIDEQQFNDALTANLRRGRFLLLIVGDGIREGVEAIAEYLQLHAGLHFSLGLIELPIYAARPPVAASPRSMLRAGRVGWLRPGSWCWRRECKAPLCRAWRDPAVMRHNTHPPISLKLKGLLRGIWCYRPW